MADENNNQPFVTVRNLTKHFGDVVAVDNLSFEVYEGEIFGFLGPNGAGKSTTLNIIASLLGYDRGNITVDGLDLAHNARKIKSFIGLVPQEIALFGKLTAKENVAFFAGLYGLTGKALKAAVSEALAFVGLTERAKTLVSRMSGGMKRRLNIACGIAHHPRLIILDEPTVGVDAQSREHIMGSIRTLRDRGATIIYTSHYMPEVQEICDRIAIIDHGCLVASGTEQELLEAVAGMKTITVQTRIPESATRQRLVSKLSVLPDVCRVAFDDERELTPDEGADTGVGIGAGTDRGAEGSVAASADSTILRIDVMPGLDDVAPLISVLMEQGVVLEALNSEAPNLETTFLALTGRELR